MRLARLYEVLRKGGLLSHKSRRWSNSCGVLQYVTRSLSLHFKENLSEKMSVKTVASYTCAIFSVVVLILCLCTNYWIEYEVIDRTVIGKDRRYRVRAGLWEYCQQVKEVTHHDFGALKCIPVDEQEGTGLKTAKRDAIFAMYLLAMLATLIAFIFVTVYCITDKYFFPVTRSAVLFFAAAIFVVVGLAIYTDNYMDKKVQFSWSYGAGWSATAMYIISVILLLADK